MTQRGLASAVAFVTGHEDPSKDETQVDWDGARPRSRGRSSSTWACGACGRIAEQLVAAGRDPGEPAAVVERGTLPGQRAVRGDAGDRSPTRAADAGIGAPAVTVVGPGGGAARRARLAGERPPADRPADRGHPRARAGQRAGRAAARRSAPRSSRRPRSASSRSRRRSPTSRPTTCCASRSPNGAERLLADARDARALAGPAIAAIGPGTARALRARRRRGRRRARRGPSPSRWSRRWPTLPVHARARRARRGGARRPARRAARARGAEVDVLALYRTVAEPLDDDARRAALGADYVTFTSASAARFFHAAAGSLDGPRLVSIGPVDERRRCARRASSPTSRPPSTPLRAWSRRSCATRRGGRASRVPGRAHPRPRRRRRRLCRRRHRPPPPVLRAHGRGRPGPGPRPRGRRTP